MTPDSMIDITEVSSILEIPPKEARAYLDIRGQGPVATYHNRPLWYADTVQDLLAGV